jgi:hypothetical protein
LVHYAVHTPGVEAGDNGTVRLDLENEPQPDAILIIKPACGGQARLSEDDYLESGPELVAEVSASADSIDLNAKFRVYRRNGVKEYIVQQQAIDWFVCGKPSMSAWPRIRPASTAARSFPACGSPHRPLCRSTSPPFCRCSNRDLPHQSTPPS